MRGIPRKYSADRYSWGAAYTGYVFRKGRKKANEKGVFAL